jgi:hypothetical protein
MSMMKFAYQYDGGPMTWRGGVPRQSRASDAKSLGSLGDATLVLPAPGAPEPLNGISCKCGGSCGCSGSKSAMDGIADTITSHPVIAAVAAYAAYRMFFKKKR